MILNRQTSADFVAVRFPMSADCQNYVLNVYKVSINKTLSAKPKSVYKQSNSSINIFKQSIYFVDYTIITIGKHPWSSVTLIFKRDLPNCDGVCST